MSQPHTQELGTLPVRRLFWRYAIPSIAGMLVTSVYYLVDGIFVGRYVGAVGLAAINLAYPLVMVCLGFGALISMGAATRIALLQGAGRVDEARRTLGCALLAAAALGGLIALLGLAAGERLPTWLGAGGDAALWRETRLYLMWMLGGSTLILGQMMVATLVRNDGRPALATVLLSSGALLNIALDYLFVVEWRMGLAGAAQATLLSEAVVCALGLGYFFSRHARLRLSLRELRLNAASLAIIARLGVSSLVMELNLALLLYAHNAQLLRYGEGQEVAAYAISGYTESLFVLLVHGLALGLQPLLGHAMGAGQTQRAREALGYGLRVVLLLGAVALLLVQLGAPLVAELYVGEADAALVALASHALRLHLMAMPLDGLVTVGVIALQSMALTREALVGSVGKTVLLLPALWGLPLWLGVDGVWLALPLVNLLLGAVMALLLWRCLRTLDERAPSSIKVYGPAG